MCRHQNKGAGAFVRAMPYFLQERAHVWLLLCTSRLVIAACPANSSRSQRCQKRRGVCLRPNTYQIWHRRQGWGLWGDSTCAKNRRDAVYANLSKVHLNDLPAIQVKGLRGLVPCKTVAIKHETQSGVVLPGDVALRRCPRPAGQGEHVKGGGDLDRHAGGARAAAWWQ